jgi:hypothetical protein
MSRDCANPPEDLVRALDGLRPRDPATRDAISGLLGYGPLAAPLPPQGQDQPRTLSVVDEPPVEPQIGQALPAGRSVSAEVIPAGVRLEPLSSPGPSLPDWLSTVEPLEEAPAVTPPAPEVAGLFEPAWRRAVLSAALATVRPLGAFELEPVIRTVCRAEAVREIRRRPVPTLAGGTQLLLDLGEGMLPFTADLERLEREIRRVAGECAVQVLQFEGCPADGAGPGPRRTWRPYGQAHTPVPGTRVLCATDLGIGAVAGGRLFDAEGWHSFARHLGRAGCPLLVLVPYAPRRWPPGLPRWFDLLHWDRRTTAARIARLIRRRQRVEAGL